MFQWQDHGDGTATMAVPVCPPRVEGTRWRFTDYAGYATVGMGQTPDDAKLQAGAAWTRWILGRVALGHPIAGAQFMVPLK
jgi:hypothetical protein